MKKLRVISCVLLLSLLIIDCQLSQLATDRGSLVVTFTSATNTGTKNILPPINMDIANYDVSGSGPSGATFSQENVTDTLTVNALAVGSWVITVNGKNSTSTVIGTGSTTAAIVAGQTTVASVTVTPVAGNGNLHLSVSWSSGLVSNPSVLATLTPVGGSAANLTFVLAGDSLSASYDAGSNLSNGYYTLSLTLKDGITVVWSGIEAVRIVSGNTTSGSFALTSTDLMATGGMNVSITPSMDSPITITLAGWQATLAPGTFMSVVASSSVPVSSYQWFLNGLAINGQTSSSYSVGPGLSLGNYRLDVMATQGSVIGSNHCTFQVQPVASLPNGRQGFAAATVSGKVYVIGGSEGIIGAGISTGTITGRVDVYDPATNSWTRKANMPTPRSGGLASAVIGGKIYVAGGYSGGFLSTLEVYDPSTDTWQARSPMPTARDDMASAVVGGKLYVMGGNSWKTVNEVYDPGTNSWSTLAPMPTGRSGCRADAIDGVIYVVGGVNSVSVLDTVEAYSPGTNSWATKAALHVPRNNSSAVALNGKLYVAGGVDSPQTSSLSSCERYDPIANAWIVINPLSTARSWLGTAVSGTVILAVGGVTFPPTSGSLLGSVDAIAP